MERGHEPQNLMGRMCGDCRENEDEELCSVFVPTNHLYIGDIFLVNSKEIIRPNLSIREGIVDGNTGSVGLDNRFRGYDDATSDLSARKVCTAEGKNPFEQNDVKST
ncbi:protein LIKE COV 2-like isoform X1 [Gossypium australe]|uniref:Protein LIKE COV 2-like isoform X1 n=1 Tax=Gossypium australe TaxID=47621 RepID=A0A5B6UZX6_9ROSI|nr:protein LIKE COV 2-like isoform X1 [Gossypium australe]